MILRAVLTSAKRVALKVTVPSLFRGMFMHTRRCTANNNCEPGLAAPRKHQRTVTLARERLCWGTELLCLLCPGPQDSAPLLGSTWTRGSDIPHPTSQLNHSKLRGEPGQICGNNPVYEAPAPWEKNIERIILVGKEL